MTMQKEDTDSHFAMNMVSSFYVYSVNILSETNYIASPSLSALRCLVLIAQTI